MRRVHCCCLAAGPAESYPDSGRLIERDGFVQAIVEVPDIHARQLAAVLRSMSEAERPGTVEDFLKIAQQHFPATRKLGKCFPSIKDTLAGSADARVFLRTSLTGSSSRPSHRQW